MSHPLAYAIWSMIRRLDPWRLVALLPPYTGREMTPYELLVSNMEDFMIELGRQLEAPLRAFAAATLDVVVAFGQAGAA